MTSRFWIATILSALSGLLFALTLAWAGWIEALTGLDPDQHNGSVEWSIAAALLAIAVLFGRVARAERLRRLQVEA
jgi:hypothetical protein